MVQLIDVPCLSSKANPEVLPHVQGKVVLITGGAGGFGREIALQVAAAGGKPVVCDLSVEGCRRTVELCRAAGGECITPSSPCDVTSVASLGEAFKFVSLPLEEGGYGKVPDIVVVNAGVTEMGGFSKDTAVPDDIPYPEEPKWTTLDVNLKGMINTCCVAQQVWAEYPTEKEDRVLIIMASLGGIDMMPGAALYATSKHACMGYWLGLNSKLSKIDGPKPFSCYAVCPFFADTPIVPRLAILALAGCAKVLPSTVAASVVSIAARPPGGTGTAILLPDDQEPFEVGVEEWEPLGVGMYDEIVGKCVGREMNPNGKEFITRRNKEFFQALKMTPPMFFASLTGVAMVMLLVMYLSYKIPTWQALALGVAMGAAYKAGKISTKVA